MYIPIYKYVVQTVILCYRMPLAVSTVSFFKM